MTFDQLRKNATAGETCLIDTVIGMVETEIREKTLHKISEFIIKNPAPSRDDSRFDLHNSYQSWFTRLNEHLTPPKKP